MAQSLMLFANLQTEILAARDEREQVLVDCLAQTQNAVVFVSTAIPGQDKCPPSLQGLFHWALLESDKELDYWLIMDNIGLNML